MKIRAVVEIDVDFDTEGQPEVIVEFNNAAIKEAVENCIMSDQLMNFLGVDLTDASGWEVTELSVAMGPIDIVTASH